MFFFFIGSFLMIKVSDAIGFVIKQMVNMMYSSDFSM